MSPLPWRVELGFAVASIVAADETVVAQNLTPEDAKTIVAALAVVEAARWWPPFAHRNLHQSGEIGDATEALDAALSAYEKASVE